MHHFKWKIHIDYLIYIKSTITILKPQNVCLVFKNPSNLCVHFCCKNWALDLSWFSFSSKKGFQRARSFLCNLFQPSWRVKPQSLAHWIKGLLTNISQKDKNEHGSCSWNWHYTRRLPSTSFVSEKLTRLHKWKQFAMKVLNMRQYGNRKSAPPAVRIKIWVLSSLM